VVVEFCRRRGNGGSVHPVLGGSASSGAHGHRGRARARRGSGAGGDGARHRGGTVAQGLRVGYTGAQEVQGTATLHRSRQQGRDAGEKGKATARRDQGKHGHRALVAVRQQEA
jgi:hypothetical protein